MMSRTIYQHVIKSIIISTRTRTLKTWERPGDEARPEDMTLIYVRTCVHPPPQAHTLYSVDRCNAFVCDLTVDKLSDVIPNKDVDLASLFFVLSAISPEKMSMALKNIHSVSKPAVGFYAYTRIAHI